jgi:IS1 family transposase
LAEGLDIAAAVRVVGHHHATITMWLTRAGAHRVTLHDRFFQDLHVPHLQLDELRTRLRSRAHTRWLWLAVAPVRTLIPVLQLGSRRQESAHALVHALCQRLSPDCLPVFTSDGLTLYFSALTAHVGRWVVAMGRHTWQWQVAAGLRYGQVKQTYRRRTVVRVTHEMRCGTQEAFTTARTGWGLRGRLNTACIERVTLTVRHSVAALMRRTWSTAQDAPQLLLHLEWWRA